VPRTSTSRVRGPLAGTKILMTDADADADAGMIMDCDEYEAGYEKFMDELFGNSKFERAAKELHDLAMKAINNLPRRSSGWGREATVTGILCCQSADEIVGDAEEGMLRGMACEEAVIQELEEVLGNYRDHTEPEKELNKRKQCLERVESLQEEVDLGRAEVGYRQADFESHLARIQREEDREQHEAGRTRALESLVHFLSGTPPDRWSDDHRKAFESAQESGHSIPIHFSKVPMDLWDQEMCDDADMEAKSEGYSSIIERQDVKEGKISISYRQSAEPGVGAVRTINRLRFDTCGDEVSDGSDEGYDEAGEQLAWSEGYDSLAEKEAMEAGFGSIPEYKAARAEGYSHVDQKEEAEVEAGKIDIYYEDIPGLPGRVRKRIR